jgi:inosine/xanthosine triphosphate pyrophosphatase family protein
LAAAVAVIHRSQKDGVVDDSSLLFSNFDVFPFPFSQIFAPLELVGGVQYTGNYR